jgi:hypothetical protein
MELWFEWIERTVGRFGSHRWTLRAMFVLGVAVVVFLYVWPQPPGVAIAFLAVGVVFMTFRQMTATQKLYWACFAIAMFCLEFRAVNADHVTQQKEANDKFQAILRDNRDRTSAILNDNQTRFAQTEKHFATVTGENKTISGLSVKNLQSAHETLQNLTGGTSFAYLSPVSPPGKPVYLTAINSGAYPLTGVTASIVRTTEPKWTEKDVDIGTIPGNGVRMSPIPLVPDIGKSAIDTYEVYVSAQNGTTKEVIQIRRSIAGDVWEHRFRVWRLKVGPDAAVSLIPLISRDKWASDAN